MAFKGRIGDSKWPLLYSLSGLSACYTALLACQFCVDTEEKGALSTNIRGLQSDEDPKKALTNSWDLTQDRIKTPRFVPESLSTNSSSAQASSEPHTIGMHFCSGLQTLAGHASSDLLLLPWKVDLFPNLAAAKSL